MQPLYDKAIFYSLPGPGYHEPKSDVHLTHEILFDAGFENISCQFIPRTDIDTRERRDKERKLLILD